MDDVSPEHRFNPKRGVAEEIVAVPEGQDAEVGVDPEEEKIVGSLLDGLILKHEAKLWSVGNAWPVQSHPSGS